MTLKRKLIEVALPLEAINKEAAREKSIRHGHPSTLHLWWARRPLAACRAVLFSSLVDDPSSHPDQFPTEEAQEKERERLFRIIEELVKWENSTNEEVLGKARAEILKSTGGHPPPVLDPFCGGGSIPLEAQRLGLEAHASDLNPVAVLITKALIEIPPKFAGLPPVNPESRKKLDHSKTWRGAQGLAEDVRYYGKWMRNEAERRIGRLYPKVKLPKGEGGGEATVIAWLWARTVTCPNPACGAQMPLVRSFAVSTRKGKETWVVPVIDKTAKTVLFQIGREKSPVGTVSRRGARCIVCESPVPLDHIRAEGKAGRMAAQLMAIVAEAAQGRVYLPPVEEHARAAQVPVPKEAPDTDLPLQALGFRVQGYGMTKHRRLFTPRQLAALTTFCGLVGEARPRAQADAVSSGLPMDGKSLDHGGTGAVAYSEGVAAYLALSASKATMFHNSLARWRAGEDKSAPAFGRQAISMVWDFAEVNPFAGAGGDFSGVIDGGAMAIASLPARAPAVVSQLDASVLQRKADSLVISTDPPYYDNIGYADLSDFFYTWLRPMISTTYPDVCSTLLTPKNQELVAAPDRFRGDREESERFFERGLTEAFRQARKAQITDFPMTVFYAFKQAETEDDEDAGTSGVVASTGWETMLEGLLEAGFGLVGTWPMRTEGASRMRGQRSNALASSILLVARPRLDSAPLTTRKEFLASLKRELPQALKRLQHGNIAPVDLAQAAIGPGMAVFSRYAKVVEADGSRMPVRTALGIINQVLDEVLAEQESEFDADTRWALAWFEQFGMNEGPYGDAETLSKAKDTSVDGLRRDGLLESKRGKVQLVSRDKLSADWNPAADSRLTVWELTQHLIRRLEAGGESAAAELLRQVGSLGDVARDLAYRLYSLCERKGWAQEAIAYNGLVTAWPELTRLASQAVPSGPGQRDLFGT